VTSPLLYLPRPRPVSMLLIGLATLLVGVLAPRAASGVQGSELYRTQASFYGRFEARVQYAPGEGVVSSFFLWKDGSSSTTTWNELDFEKINAVCKLQNNIWTGKGTQSAQTTTPAFDACNSYHTYVIEWTPDYISWLIDGTQIRKVTGANVTEYTMNASAGMATHFNLWAGDSSFGGTFNASVLPVRQYINWAQYSSYANGAFQLQWREDFNGSTVPSGWAVGNWVSPLNHSTHNPSNVSFVNGIAVLSMTADNATGYSGTPPADPAGGGGVSGTGGAGTGGAGTGGNGGTTGGGGRGGTGGSTSSGSGGTSSTGSGGSGSGGAASGGTGGVANGTGGSGSGGTSVSTGGNGSGGASIGTGGSGTGGPSGSGGDAAGSGGTGGSAAGSGGSSGSGGAAAGTGGVSGGMPSGDAGCGCRAAGGGPASGGLVAVLLFAANSVRRRARRSEKSGR
jgi:endo-1,3-1,4-beta-glycanase ExoK